MGIAIEIARYLRVCPRLGAGVLNTFRQCDRNLVCLSLQSRKVLQPLPPINTTMGQHVMTREEIDRQASALTDATGGGRRQ